MRAGVVDFGRGTMPCIQLERALSEMSYGHMKGILTF